MKVLWIGVLLVVALLAVFFLRIGLTLQEAQKVPAAPRKSVRQSVPEGYALIQGRVVDAHDRTVAKAEVEVAVWPKDPAAPSTRLQLRSNDDGWFQFHSFPWPREVWITAHSPDGTATGQKKLLPPAFEEDLVLRLLPGAAVRGVLLDEHDRPLSGVALAIRSNSIWDPGKPAALIHGDMSAVTDSLGRFIVKGLPEGEIFVAALDERWVVDMDQPLKLEAGATHHLQLRARMGLTLKGLVVDDRNRPVAEAQVIVKPDSGGWRKNRSGGMTQTDATGHFALAGLHGEPVTVLVIGGYRHVKQGGKTVKRALSARAKMTGVRPGSSPITITLVETAPVR